MKQAVLDLLFTGLGASLASAFWAWRMEGARRDADAAWRGMRQMMVKRLGYTPQGADAAIEVWRRNRYGKARLGGAEIAQE